MNYNRCKCGLLEEWESGMPPAACEVCEKCGSTLAWSVSSHADPVPHEFKDEWIIRAGEPIQIRRCQRCLVMVDIPMEG